MGLAQIALDAGKRKKSGNQVANIIDFIESSWGLNIELFPVQRVILKAHYGVALDDNPWGLDLDEPVPKDHPEYDKIAVLPVDEEEDEIAFDDIDLADFGIEGLDASESEDDTGFYKNRVKVVNWRKEHPRYMSEADYLKMLYAEGRCNIDKVIPGRERRELVLSIGRRSGKTFLCACVVAYEVYKLILKDNPQSYYGIPKTNVIQLISVATDKDQAGLLYNEASGHFSNCPFYQPYTANNTMSYAKFQSPEDIKRFGKYAEDPTAKATIKVSFKSCVAKGLRGAGNIVIILDELAHFNDVGQSDALKIYRAVKPSLASFSPKHPHHKRRIIGKVEGRILSISSPLGKQGFFYRKYRQGFAGGLESRNMLCIQAPTWEVNPTVEATFLAEEYATDPDSFFTEFGADFTDRTKGWLTLNPLMACVDPNARPSIKAPVRAPHFMGIDISAGLVDGDYCAVAIGHLDNKNDIVLDHIERIRAGEGEYENLERLSFDEITAWLYGLSRRFYIESGIFDQWAGIPFEAALHKRGLKQCESVFFTKQLSSQIFANFKTLMFEKRLGLFDFPKVEDVEGEPHAAYIAELMELQAETQSKYIITVEAPNAPGKYDDYSDALVRMVWQATQHMGKQKYIAGSVNRGHAQRSGMTVTDVAKAQRKAMARSRFGGSSPDRQRSSVNRGMARGRKR